MISINLRGCTDLTMHNGLTVYGLKYSDGELISCGMYFVKQSDGELRQESMTFDSINTKQRVLKARNPIIVSDWNFCFINNSASIFSCKFIYLITTPI